jgi:hypothetical protein
MYGAASSGVASSPPSAWFNCTSMPTPPDHAKLPTSITARRGHCKHRACPVEVSAEPDGRAIDPALETRGGDQYDKGETRERDGDSDRIRQGTGQRDKTRAAKGEQNREMQQVDAE